MAEKGAAEKRKSPAKRMQSGSSSIPPGPAGPADISGHQVGNFRCDECGTPFPSNDALDAHMEQAHRSS